MSHHFFSWRANRRNSLNRRHIFRCNLKNGPFVGKCKAALKCPDFNASRARAKPHISSAAAVAQPLSCRSLRAKERSLQAQKFADNGGVARWSAAYGSPRKLKAASSAPLHCPLTGLIGILVKFCNLRQSH
jgi:hypothetical protein